MSKRIEFYKNRSTGERFSVAVDFLKQNWKILYKNILSGGLPLAIILSYFLVQQTNAQTISDLPNFFMHYSLFILVSFMNFIYLFSMTGTVLFHYDRNRLTETTGWNDLKDTFFKFTGKTLLITIIVYIPIIVIVGIIAAIFGFSVSAIMTDNAKVGFLLLFILLIILLLAGTIAFAPSLTMLYFPAYFSGKTNVESIKSAFSLGFKNWGSLFVAIILVGIVFYVIYIVFSIPFLIESIFLPGKVNIVSYILATLSSIGTLLMYPIMIVVFAFQYFSIVEKEEGVSLQSQLDDFENL